MNEFNGVVVVGGGIAGLTAAMYSARLGCLTRLYEGDPFDSSQPMGGQLMLAERTQFVPGYPEGIDGPTLMAKLREQAEAFDIDFVPGCLQAITTDGPILTAVSADGSFVAGAVVLATGGRPRLLGVGEHAFLGMGVSLCAMCDAPLYRDREVVVVGGGDSAADEAILLARHARRVTVLHRGAELDAHPRLAEELREIANVDIQLGAEVLEIVGDQVVKRLAFRSAEGVAHELATDGIFLAIGRVPNSELVHAIADVDANGYVVVNADGATSVASLYACGECADPRFRQIATAIGSGCRAGMSAAAEVLGEPPHSRIGRASR